MLNMFSLNKNREHQKITVRYFLLSLIFYSFLSILALRGFQLFYIFLHNTFSGHYWSYSKVNFVKNYDDIFDKLFPALVLAPLFETFVFCFLIYKGLMSITKSKVIFLFVSAFFFGLFHLVRQGSGWYTFGYTFLIGLIYAYCFLNISSYKHSSNLMVAFSATALVHFFYNFAVIFFLYS